MQLIVGLGNPGRDYQAHRHNVGFRVIDAIAKARDADAFRTKFGGKIARLSLRDDDLWLLKPQTYMNRSGDSVQPCAAFYKIAVEDIVVVHDELDLPFGTVRIKKGGGHAGHNGLRDIIARLGSPEFLRVRVGIGRPPAGYRGDVADYVLSGFSKEEQENLLEPLAKAAKSVLDIATRGAAAAMKRHNTKPKKKKAPKPAEGPLPDGSGPDNEET